MLHTHLQFIQFHFSYEIYSTVLHENLILEHDTIMSPLFFVLRVYVVLNMFVYTIFLFIYSKFQLRQENRPNCIQIECLKWNGDSRKRKNGPYFGSKNHTLCVCVLKMKAKVRIFFAFTPFWFHSHTLGISNYFHMKLNASVDVLNAASTLFQLLLIGLPL